MNVTISISTFKIGSGRAERKVSPDCRPPSIITAPKPSKILSEPCGYREKVACGEYLNALKNLVEASEDTDPIKADIATCEMKLQQGKQTNSNLYGSVTKAENVLEQCKTTFNLLSTVSILSKIKKPEVDTIIEEYSEYLYSPTYVSRIDKILSDAEKLLDENFSSFVSKLTCAYSQSSEFKKKYQNAVKQLQEIGKKEYANILKKRIETVLKEAELEQKYSATMADARRFISVIDNSVHTFDFPKCAEVDAQISGWLQTFSAATDMLNSVRDEFMNALRETQNNVKKQKTALNSQIKKILNEIDAPSESASLLSEHIAKSIRLNPDEKTLIKLTNAQTLLEEFNKLKSTIVERDNSTIERLENDYKSKWKGSVCDKYMSEFIESLKVAQSQKRNDWLRKNVSNIKVTVETMTIPQCVQWQNSMLDLPEFLTQSDLEEINDLSVRITEKIKTQKINGVIEMFASLSSEERKECLRRLQEL